MRKKEKSLPYENATSGEKALAEMQRILLQFGCQSFGSMLDWEKQVLIVHFKHRGAVVQAEASIKGYAAAWLKQHPWSPRVRRTRAAHEKEALRVGSFAVYSVLRDWIKGQITAVETGILSFEGAFLGQIMLPSGKNVLEHVQGTTKLLLSSGDDS